MSPKTNGRDTALAPEVWNAANRSAIASINFEEPIELADRGDPSTLEIGAAAGVDLFGAGLESAIRRGDVSIEQIQKMLRVDGDAAAIFAAIRLPIREAGWRMEAAKNGRREAKFVEDALKRPAIRGGLVTRFDDFLNQLLAALRDGNQIFEKVWHRREDDGAWTLRKLAHRPSAEITFKTDHVGDLREIIQRPKRGGGPLLIPPERAVVAVHDHAENPWYGQSAFEPAYWHHRAKLRLYFVAGLAYQLMAIPIRVGTMPVHATAEKRRKFLELLTAIVTNSAITLEEGFSITPFESKRELKDFLPLIQHHSSKMGMSFLAGFFSLGQEGKSGAFALSRDHSSFFLMLLNGLLRWVADIINSTIVSELIDYNFGSEKYPTFTFNKLPDDSVRLTAETFDKIITSSTKNTTDEFALEVERLIAERLGIDAEIDYDERRGELRLKKSAAAAIEIGGERESGEPGEPATPEPGAAAASDALHSPAWRLEDVAGPDGEKLRVLCFSPENITRARALNETARAEGEEIFRAPLMDLFDGWHRDLIQWLHDHPERLEDARRQLEDLGVEFAEGRGSPIKPAAANEIVNGLFGGFAFSSTEQRSKVLLAAVTDVFNVGGSAALDQIGMTSAFGLRNQEIITAMRDRVNLISGASDEIFGEVKRQIAAGIQHGGNPMNTARALDDVWDQISPARARLIARTETKVILDQANREVYLRSGIDGMQWITAGDAKVRDRHAANHGKILWFPPRGSGAYPSGEMTAGAIDPYNCRCNDSPVVIAGNAANITGWTGA